VITAEVIRVSMSIAEAAIGLGVTFALGFALGLWARW